MSVSVRASFFLCARPQGVSVIVGGQSGLCRAPNELIDPVDHREIIQGVVGIVLVVGVVEGSYVSALFRIERVFRCSRAGAAGR